MVGHGTKFGRKKEAAVAALLSHRTIEDAAQAINIAPRTLLRWMQIAEFKAAFLEARRGAVDQASARMQQSTGAAATTVLRLMTDPAVPPAVRLRAAECVFNHAIRAIEIEDIEARVSELENAVEDAKHGGRKRRGYAS